ncbi:hypothetical protein Bhyg_04378 [Pseudolycoriella hygida]|uniref:Uncharacterized protein n=1 Tax=Pseudolycoriella hygida TaxID=35572 RepID=A0A9Q0SA11_9DIPT|nr:hypothetical protein Bhyg_04378 [Pseudolycoriella hygida]
MLTVDLNVFRVMMVVAFLKSILTSPLTNGDVNAEMYKTFLNNVLSTSPEVQRTEDAGQKLADTRKSNESPYERVLRNLRTNWETPMAYLQERGYLKKLDSHVDENRDLSMDAFNLINGPLYNPSTSRNFYPIPHGPNFISSEKIDRSDRGADTKVENAVKSLTKTRSYDEKMRDCIDSSMRNDLNCLEEYFGENWVKNVKDKWNSWFKKNQSTISSTANSPVQITTTTSFPTSTVTPFTNSYENIEEVSDSRLHDAQNGLEYFKIYNDLMLAKLASRLSQDAHKQQTSYDTKIQTLENSTQVPIVPDFSKFNDNDIKVLKELDSCLKMKKISTNTDSKFHNTKTEEVVDDATNERVSNPYVQTKLKFLAHLHHDVIGQIKPSFNRKIQGITKRGTAN